MAEVVLDMKQNQRRWGMDSKEEMLIKEILIRFKSGSEISVSLIQRRCSVGYNLAYRVLELLIEKGIAERGGSKLSPCKIK